MKKHLFVLCSHNSGSTVLWQFLQTSPHVSVLPGEGQYLEGVRDIMNNDPWSSTTKFPWELIKTEWEKEWNLNKPILLEKSPPNLMRAFEIEKVFPNSYFVIMMRNPYAYCEGSKRKYLKGWSYSDLAKRWIDHAQHQLKNINGLQKVIYFTYEEFTENPSEIIKNMLHFFPELETLDSSFSTVRKSVYGNVSRPITNFNAAQIANLSDADILEISEILKQYPDIMEFFNYRYEAGGFKRAISNVPVKVSTWYIKYYVRNIQRVLRRLGVQSPS